MASKKFVKDLVTSFLTLTPKKLDQEEIQSLENLYHAAFHGYTDKQVKEAGQKYLEEGEFFPPRPKEILDRIKDAVTDKHTRELVERYTCAACHQKAIGITDGICLDCAGLPRMNYETLKLPDPTKGNYKIEGRMLCNQCGAVGMCIKEPLLSGEWRCRKCYTGMTGPEIAATFGKLAEMVG